MKAQPALLTLPLCAALLAGCTQQQYAREVPYTETDAGKITWYRDVLPLARKHCQGCHDEGGIAPFPMDTYEHAEEFAESIGAEVEARTMPPWLPDPACNSFHGDRRLTQAEIDIFKAWWLDGALAGDPASAPPGEGTEPDHLTSVDATLVPETSYTPVGDPDDPERRDDYHCFVLDPKLEADRYLVAFEVIPGVRREVHHVLLYPATAAQAAEADARTPEPGWTCFGGPGTGGSTILGGWVPGMTTNRFPATTGIQMKAGELVVMQIHYNLENFDLEADPPLPDSTTILLDYADGLVEKPAQIHPLADHDFVIPPMTDSYTTTADFTLPVDANVWGLIPHMHTRGKSISVKVGERCFVDIPRWDFHWQQSYFFAQGGIPLAKGETATLSCTWSNDTDQPIRWGESTSDEMCITYAFLTR